MSINQIQGGNNPQQVAHVTVEGRLLTKTVALDAQQDAAEHGNTYNVDTGVFTLTDDAETPVLFLCNVGEDVSIKLSRLSLTAGPSAGGAGQVLASLHTNITGGSIVTDPEAPFKNLNVTSPKTPMATARRGVTGSTFVSGNSEPVLRALFPGAPLFAVAPYDHVVIPRGGSVLIAITPPPGNTSMTIMASLLIFLEGA